MDADRCFVWFCVTSSSDSRAWPLRNDEIFNLTLNIKDKRYAYLNAIETASSIWDLDGHASIYQKIKFIK